MTTVRGIIIDAGGDQKHDLHAFSLDIGVLTPRKRHMGVRLSCSEELVRAAGRLLYQLAEVDYEPERDPSIAWHTHGTATAVRPIGTEVKHDQA